MKFSILSLFVLVIAFTISCKKDDCEPGNLETNIVGTWSVEVLGIHTGDVTFHANGTLDDPDDVLVGGEIGGVVLDEKTYTVSGNTSINTKAAKGSNSIDFDYDVSDYTCDEINFDAGGISAKMVRK